MSYNSSWDGVFNPGKADDFFAAGSMPFMSGKHGFSATNGWWLAEMSRLIYLRGGRNCDPGWEQSIRNRYLDRAGLEESWYHNGRFVQCAIIRSKPGKGEQFAALVFRGTRRGMTNWSFLLNFFLADWPTGGKVHGGFKKVFLDAWAHIQPELEKIKVPLFFTGHSLGGALAVLAATLMNPAAVYTFGCPRFANPAFILATDHLRIHRVVNPRDVVASIPPLPGIKHVGDVHTLEPQQQKALNLNMAHAPAFLADHSPANYSLGLDRFQHRSVREDQRSMGAVLPKY